MKTVYISKGETVSYENLTTECLVVEGSDDQPQCPQCRAGNAEGSTDHQGPNTKLQLKH